jgi:guanylate kinase
MEAENRPDSAIQKGKLVLLIGPSGVGKSVILKRILAMHPEFHIPRSATTRAQRDGESGDLYHFVSDEEFDALIAAGKTLEWAIVHGGARYATIVDEIVPFIEQGKTVIREVDVQGFVSIQNHPIFKDGLHRLQSIFILPESQTQLIEHIMKRASMSEDELARRLESMEKELAYAKHCSASVVNREGKLEETIGEVEKLIIAK